MVVHAHPDDEASSTGGILARYSRQGVRTVLVTCTDGAQGDAPGGIKPGEPGHDVAEVVALRERELRRSCEVLGVDHLELLGYRDSGMMGWSSNEARGSFWTTPIDVAARRLADLMEIYQPQVVVTYDPTGFYGHPDHIQTHRVALAAFGLSQAPRRLYYPTIPRSRFGDFRRVMAELGEQAGGASTDGERDEENAEGEGAAGGKAEGQGGGEDEAGEVEIFTSGDEEIAAWVDCSSVADLKLEALRSHASQSDNVFFVRLPPEVFRRFFSVEAFVLASGRDGEAPGHDDLFSGLA